jgi:hypothetical protein
LICLCTFCTISPTSSYEYFELIAEHLCAAAGKLNSNGNELLVFGKQFGKVFIGVQPTFGYEGDPMRLLFSRSASPHHGFAAFYTYLEKIFKVTLLHRWQAVTCPSSESGIITRQEGRRLLSLIRSYEEAIL